MTQQMLLYGPQADARKRTRAVIYVRVSSDKAGGASVAEQEKHCRLFAAMQGWDVVAVYCDNDKSANENSSDVREEWERLVVELEAGRFDFLVVWEPSRATRDEQVWHTVAAACVKRGVQFVANNRLYDPADPEDRFMLDLFFALARREAAMTRKRVLRGSGDRAKSGIPGVGKAPFGYRRVYSQDTRRMSGQIPDYEERITRNLAGDVFLWKPAEVLRSIFGDALAGISAHQIAETLNENGIPNPRTFHAMEHHPKRPRRYDGRWHPAVIKRILQNPAYLGHRLHNGVKVAEGRWEALVEEEDFFAIQNLFAARRTQKRRPTQQRHLLSYFAMCRSCSRGVGFTNQGGVDAYRCRLGHSYVRKAEAERYVEWWIMSWLAVPAHLDEIRLSTRDEREIAEARAEVERLEADLAGWEADAVSGDVDRAVYKARKAVLEPQIQDARKRAFELGLPFELMALADLEDPSAGWVDLVFDAQRQILTYLLDVEIVPVGRGVKNVPVDQRVVVSRKQRDHP